MIYESEKTAYIQFETYNGEKTERIIKLPKRIVYLLDTSKNTGQLMIFTDDNWDELKEDQKFMTIAISNDPFMKNAMDWINLGYYSIRLMLSHGKIFGTNPIIYATDDLDHAQIRSNLPLRTATKLNNTNSDFDFFKYMDDTQQIIDIRLKESTQEDIVIIYSYFNYIEEGGYTKVFKANLSSFYNDIEVKTKQPFTTMSSMFEFHGLNQD